MDQIPNPEYHKIKIDVLVYELQEFISNNEQLLSDPRFEGLKKIVRKHSFTLATYGNPSILSNVPENLH